MIKVLLNLLILVFKYLDVGECLLEIFFSELDYFGIGYGCLGKGFFRN